MYIYILPLCNVIFFDCFVTYKSNPYSFKQIYPHRIPILKILHFKKKTFELLQVKEAEIQNKGDILNMKPAFTFVLKHKSTSRVHTYKAFFQPSLLNYGTKLLQIVWV